MSRKKKYLCIGLDEEVILKLDQEAAEQERSRTFVVNRVLRERYSLLREGELESAHANQP